MAEYEIFPSISEDLDIGEGDVQTDMVEEDDVCGVELARGGVCERPADECPYHD